MLAVADNTRPDSLATRQRRKRFALFQELVARIDTPPRILDVGGTEDFWRMMQPEDAAGWRVTLLNLEPQTVTRPGFESVSGDARDLSDFGAASFDVVFSNSVIEHFASFAEQRQVAGEMMRVGKRFFVQTPNRHFPVEPHFLFPFFQYLPLSWRAGLLQRFRLGWQRREPDRAEALRAVRTIRLLNRRELALLFPGARLYEERIVGLVKSFVAHGGWEEGETPS